MELLNFILIYHSLSKIILKSQICYEYCRMKHVDIKFDIIIHIYFAKPDQGVLYKKNMYI